MGKGAGGRTIAIAMTMTMTMYQGEACRPFVGRPARRRHASVFDVSHPSSYQRRSRIVRHAGLKVLSVYSILDLLLHSIGSYAASRSLWMRYYYTAVPDSNT
jgi:hypothetical protein